VLKPGKRVRQTINPALALKDGKPYMVVRHAGADTQPQAQLQFFLNVAEFGMNVQQALDRTTWSARRSRARTIRTRPRASCRSGDAAEACAR
jgi:gamma-glutamyltranspeptidase/glutathione hydrolase